MDIVNVFKTLGLKDDHLKIYLASLEWGETSISNLASKAKIPRTTVYLLIEDLINAGLIKQSLKHGSKNYFPAEPEYLMSLLKQKELEVQQIISELQNKMTDLKVIQNTRKNKPKLHYLEGSEGIKQAYEMSLNTEDTVLIQCFTENYGEIVSEEWFNDYFDRFFSSNIKSKELLKVADAEYIKKYGSDKNLQLKVETNGDINTDMMIFDEIVIFVSFDPENPYALVIEDHEISSCMRNMYELAWKRASTEDPRVRAGEKVKTEF